MLSHLLKMSPALFALVIGSHAASAHVTSLASASFVVSAQVVASCSIDTDAGSLVAADCGSAAPRVGRVPVSDLSDPTTDEAAAGAATQVVTVTY